MLMVLVVVCAGSVAAVKPAPTIEIAPGVFMPQINLGISNHTLWMEVGGRGLDTALVYGDQAQAEVGEAVRESSLSRDAIFVTTKVPCCPATVWENFATQQVRARNLEMILRNRQAHPETLGLTMSI